MQNSFDFIDDYIFHRLSPEENTAFEKNLYTNTALMAAVEEQKQLLANLKRLRLKQLIAEATDGMPVQKPTSYKWLGIGIAITISSIVLGYFIWKNDDIPQRAPLEKIETKPTDNEKYDEPRAEIKAQTVPVEKASTPTEKKPDIENVVAQKQNNQFSVLDSIAYAIADAPIGFDNWDEKNGMVRGETEEQTYFEAYKNLKNGATEKAIADFKILITDKKFRNYRRAEWYLALGQLEQNPSSKNEILNRIINTQGHYFQQKAKLLKLYLQRNNR
jgi:hypothetical protein